MALGETFESRSRFRRVGYTGTAIAVLQSGSTGFVPILRDTQTVILMVANVEAAAISPVIEGLGHLRRRLDDHIREHQQEILEFSRPPLEDVMSIVLEEIESLPSGEPIYPSDIAWKHQIEPELVEQAMDRLAKEGKLVTRDSSPAGRPD